MRQTRDEQSGCVGLWSEQPLSREGRALAERAYTLFTHFEAGLADEHRRMLLARKRRMQEHEDRSGTAPPGNALLSCMDNAVADQLDNMPTAQMLPEREETARDAEQMSDVVGHVLYQSGFERIYQTVMEDAAVTGTGICEVFWDETADEGAGMVRVQAWHPENFYPDPACEDIQDGRGCFKTARRTADWVREHYPQAADYIRGDRIGQRETEEAPEPEGDERVTMIEYWYKRYDAQTRRTAVHLAQLAGRVLVYSTELGIGVREAERAAYRERGVYAHGQYPFTLYRYRPAFGRPFGRGMADDHGRTQELIDRYIQYLDDNARASSRQRHFVRRGSGLDAEDVADLTRDIIEWDGSDIREVLQTVQAQPLNPQVLQFMQYMTDSMKQDSGQNQFARGDGGLGVTAASAIQALQEAGGKVTRMHTEIYKSAFREMIEQLLRVLSEYVDAERVMRITGVSDMGEGLRDERIAVGRIASPTYTVRVQVQKHNPLQIQTDNEFLLQAAQICAQAGTPMRARTVIGMMQGYPTRSAVLRRLREDEEAARMQAEGAYAHDAQTIWETEGEA